MAELGIPSCKQQYYIECASSRQDAKDSSRMSVVVHIPDNSIRAFTYNILNVVLLADVE